MANTLKDLRQRLGGIGFCDDLTITTAISGSDSTKVVDNKLTFANDALNYGWVAIVSGSASGNRRRIADWVLSTTTLTPDRNFTAAVSSGDGVEIHQLFSPDRKDAALNQCIRESDRKWLRHIEDETIVIVADTYKYRIDNLTVPVDRTLGIDNVWESESGEPEWYRIDPNTWHIRDVAGTLYLDFDTGYLPATDQVIRLQYRVYPPTLTADTSTLNPDEDTFANFLCAKAAGLLFQGKADTGEEAAREHWQMRADTMKVLSEQLYGLRFHVTPKRAQTRSGW